jgi:hypothetical protein
MLAAVANSSTTKCSALICASLKFSVKLRALCVSELKKEIKKVTIQYKEIRKRIKRIEQMPILANESLKSVLSAQSAYKYNS